MTGAEPNISNLSVRNMECSEAQQVIRSFSTIDKTFTAGTFSCARLDGGPLGGTWRCVSGEKAFRFAFGD